MGPSTRSGCRRFGLTMAALVLAVAACSADAGTVGSAPSDPAELEGMLTGLEVDYGCGQGFYASDAAQTRGVFLFAADPAMTIDELGIPGEVELPDDRWIAYVETGQDLFANWCDDVVTPDEPERLVDQHLDIAAGTMTVTQDGPERFTAELTDVEVEAADGTAIELGRLTTTNDLWGLYAG
jgi:hypothetical protein